MRRLSSNNVTLRLINRLKWGVDLITSSTLLVSHLFSIVFFSTHLLTAPRVNGRGQMCVNLISVARRSIECRRGGRVSAALQLQHVAAVASLILLADSLTLSHLLRRSTTSESRQNSQHKKTQWRTQLMSPKPNDNIIHTILTEISIIWNAKGRKKSGASWVDKEKNETGRNEEMIKKEVGRKNKNKS